MSDPQEMLASHKEFGDPAVGLPYNVILFSTGCKCKKSIQSKSSDKVLP